MEGWQLVGGMVGAFLLGLAWIGKVIIKPWSDAYLVEKKANAQAALDKSVAETQHIRNLDAALVQLCTDSHKQTTSLALISDRTGEQTVVLTQQSKTQENTLLQLKDMGSDNKRLCRAEVVADKAAAMGITPEKLEELLSRVIRLQEESERARMKIVETAAAQEAILREVARTQAEELEAKAKGAEHSLQARAEVVKNELQANLAVPPGFRKRKKKC